MRDGHLQAANIGPRPESVDSPTEPAGANVGAPPELVEGPTEPTKCRESDQLEAAKSAFDIVLKAYEREKANQSHLWGRFRDTIKLFIATLAVIAFVAQALISQVLSQQPLSAWETVASVVGFVLVALAIGFAVTCGAKLYIVYDGQEFSDVLPSDIYRTFLEQSAYVQQLAGKTIASDEGLGKAKSLFVGPAQTDSLTRVFVGLSVTMLRSADDHCTKSEQRETTLRATRPLLLAAFLAATLAWFASIFQAGIQ